jgi:hypothetical protein
MSVDGLVLRDPEEPGPQVVGPLEPRIAAHGRDPGLLEAVVRVAGPGGDYQEAVDLDAVGVEQRLKGRQIHALRTHYSPAT